MIIILRLSANLNETHSLLKNRLRPGGGKDEIQGKGGNAACNGDIYFITFRHIEK